MFDRLLLRLSPLIPYNVFNYIIAASSVTLRDFTLALPAMLPATFGYVYIGATIAEAASAAGGSSTAAQGVQVALLVVGAVATVVATAIISLVAKRHLKRKLDRSGDTSEGVAAAQVAISAPDDVALGISNEPPSP